VYARGRGGAIDRRRRIPTDVIALGRVRFACAAGTRLDAAGERGTLTLLFRNRPDGKTYALTCAHVAGDLLRSPPADPRLRSRCCRRRVFATTIASSVAAGRAVDWDVAIARVESACTPQPALRVAGSKRALRRLRPAAGILPGRFVACAASRSGRFRALVASDARALRVRLDGVEYRVRNLFLLRARVLPGDSGGLVFDGDEAIGILVATAGEGAPGFGLFQPLAGAFAHVARRAGIPLRLFDATRRGGHR
jgi:hypothetical protein